MHAEEVRYDGGHNAGRRVLRKAAARALIPLEALVNLEARFVPIPLPSFLAEGLSFKLSDEGGW
jgi:hypothetical protein